MKHFNIDNCTCKKGNEWYVTPCGINAFIFYHNLEFYLITSNTCLHINNLEDKSSIIHEILEKSKNSEYTGSVYNDGRMNLDKSLKENRLRNLSLSRNVNEVNFIYKYIRDNTLKCITHYVKYEDLAYGQEKLKYNYNKAKDYLIANGFNNLLDGVNGLKNLYESNKIENGYNIELQSSLSIDHLVKTIKKEIKN